MEPSTVKSWDRSCDRLIAMRGQTSVWTACSPRQTPIAMGASRSWSSLAGSSGMVETRGLSAARCRGMTPMVELAPASLPRALQRVPTPRLQKLKWQRHPQRQKHHHWRLRRRSRHWHHRFRPQCRPRSRGYNRQGASRQSCQHDPQYRRKWHILRPPPELLVVRSQTLSLRQASQLPCRQPQGRLAGRRSWTRRFRWNSHRIAGFLAATAMGRRASVGQTNWSRLRMAVVDPHPTFTAALVVPPAQVLWQAFLHLRLC